MDGGRLDGFGGQQAVKVSVNGYSVFFKKGGEFHRIQLNLSKKE